MADGAKTGISPAFTELERIVRGSQSFDATLTFELSGGQKTVLNIKAKGRPSWISYCIDEKEKYCNNLETAMTMVTEPVRNKAARLTDVSVRSKGTEIAGKELKNLVMTAFCQMVGVPVPKESELKAIAGAAKDKQEQMREHLVGILRTGPDGVKHWNEGDTRESRREAGHFKKTDIQNVDLSGLRLFLSYNDMADFQGSNFSGSTFKGGCLDSCDFRKSIFRGANLLDTHVRGTRASDCDFSRANMERTSLRVSTLQKCNFENAILIEADLHQVDARESNFKAAKLTRARMIQSKSSDCDFSNANLQKIDFSYSDLQRSNFHGADLTEANLTGCDLRGADFSAAKMARVVFERTAYDERTKFPSDLAVSEGLNWKGTGPDPAMMARVKEISAQGPVDFEEFVKKLNLAFDQERLKKAMKMLKAERFQLFAEVSDEHVIGVVKSQTDPDLVYSCRLACDGKFSCCTQNLFPCGGLRGALCKHLLVLLLGLTRAGEFDTTQACAWVITSKSQQPALDKEIASATFLRYKGAEAGEVDWRPTETIPEDFYAF